MTSHIATIDRPDGYNGARATVQLVRDGDAILEVYAGGWHAWAGFPPDAKLLWIADPSSCEKNQAARWAVLAGAAGWTDPPDDFWNDGDDLCERCGLGDDLEPIVDVTVYARGQAVRYRYHRACAQAELSGVPLRPWGRP